MPVLDAAKQCCGVTTIGLWLMADVTHDVSLTRCDTMMMGMSIADADADGGGGCGGGV